MDLEKQYNPQLFEERIYRKWLDNKSFHSQPDHDKKPFTIVIPPPNVTGILHMGHAWVNTMQDILIRFKRMQGFNALWVPGTDHASISTEVKVIERLEKEGLRKDMIGREEFLRRAWEWKEEYGGTIISQLKKLGCSCDWDRERFTMDSLLTKAVLETFQNLYDKGYIYRGERIINWCPKCKTTISDAEVNHEDKNGSFWHIRYQIKDSNEYLQIATTRPETMLGDTALAVNPQDERYAAYVGKTVILPLLNREIPVIADAYVDKEFGTGVVKITPAHDPNDFAVGARHKLPIISVMNDDGTMNENAGSYAGLDRYEARKQIVNQLKQEGLLIKIEPLTHAVGVHERCHTVVEPLVKKQWFVKMEEMAKPAIEVYKNGTLSFASERYGKMYLSWLENIHDWCISRQLWWGHRIPAYYCQACNHITVAKNPPTACDKCGSTQLKQDEDTLDTWFSSALWPFAVLGWPDKTDDMAYYFPTDVLVTAYDIVFFWVVRMVFSSLEQTGTIPFKTVVMHGLMRDAQGRKFSKSLGNGVDPLDAIEKYGADALRLSIILGNDPANDMRFYMEKVEVARNFANKLWNASRFVLMNLDGSEELADPASFTQADKWILGRLNKVVKEVTNYLESYDLGLSVQKVYDFLWDEYCDWYIEMVKPRLFQKDDPTRAAALSTLQTCLQTALHLLHPYMPFITEHLYEQMTNQSIMVSSWPLYDENLHYEKDEEEIELMKAAVKAVRVIRADMSVPPSKKLRIYLETEKNEINRIFEDGRGFFMTLSNASDFIVGAKGVLPETEGATAAIPSAQIYIPLDDLMDYEKEAERLSKEQKRLVKEVERAEQKLANPGFLDKAPDSLVAAEKVKLEKYKSELAQVNDRINSLKK